MIELLFALTLQSAPAPCAPLTEADKSANRALGFAEFDQGESDLPTTGWNLTMAHCSAQAVEAQTDYLLFGPPLSDRERTVIRWHMAQDLARVGRTEEAAILALSSLQDLPPAEDAFDWNSYVRGVYGFLVRDRSLLDRSLAALKALPGQRNASNATALERLARCFDRPFLETETDPVCKAD